MPLLISAVYFALLVLVLVDIITRDQWRIRYLDKVSWVFIVIFLPLIGSILWFVIGRLYEAPMSHGRYANSSRFLDRPAVRPTMLEEPRLSAMSDEERIESEIAFHEKQARIRRLEEDIQSRREEGQAR